MENNKLHFKEEESLLQNENYKKYSVKKKEIKAKYPSEIFMLPTQGNHKENSTKENFRIYIEQHRELYKEYIKELANLLFEPEGDFQQFTWDIIPEVDKKHMERRARGRKKREQ